MFIAGIKFGIGFWLATVAFVVFAMAVTNLVSYLRDYFKKQKDRRNFPKVHKTKIGHLLWTRGPHSVQYEDEPLQAFSFRTTIRWSSRENTRERRKEPHYRN